MRYLKKFNQIKELTQYHNLNGDDDYEITKTIRDDRHDYQYCDNILYEISDENNIVVSVDEVKETEENTFYEDQIERYIQYFEEGGITQTFPVKTSPLGGCFNLEEMLEYLEEPDNFDLAWDLLGTHHRKILDINKYDITMNPEDFGFNDEMKLYQVVTIEDLDNSYNEDIMDNEDRMGDYDEELYNGFVAILEYWETAKEYTLSDFNHRFTALKRMGKSSVIVDPS